MKKKWGEQEIARTYRFTAHEKHDVVVVFLFLDRIEGMHKLHIRDGQVGLLEHLSRGTRLPRFETLQVPTRQRPRTAAVAALSLAQQHAPRVVW
jgi:hypothetical protein